MGKLQWPSRAYPGPSRLRLVQCKKMIRFPQLFSLFSYENLCLDKSIIFLSVCSWPELPPNRGATRRHPLGLSCKAVPAAWQPLPPPANCVTMMSIIFRTFARFRQDKGKKCARGRQEIKHTPCVRNATNFPLVIPFHAAAADTLRWRHLALIARNENATQPFPSESHFCVAPALNYHQRQFVFGVFRRISSVGMQPLEYFPFVSQGSGSFWPI